MKINVAYGLLVKQICEFIIYFMYVYILTIIIFFLCNDTIATVVIIGVISFALFVCGLSSY